jgi:hypothetical protein
LIMKVIVGFSFCLVMFTLWRTGVHGYRSSYDRAEVEPHRVWAWRTLILTIGAIVLTEIMVRINGGLHNRTLFLIHLPFAILFLGSLLIQFRITGKRLLFHRAVGCVCLGSYLCSFCTGMALLWSL